MLHFPGSSTAWLLPASYPAFVKGVEGSSPRNISLEELQIYGDANVAVTEESSATDAIALNVHSIRVGVVCVCVCVWLPACVCPFPLLMITACLLSVVDLKIMPKFNLILMYTMMNNLLLHTEHA